MTLPIDRTALVAAQSNQVPNALIRSAQNIAAIQAPYDTIDELYAFTVGLINQDTLSRLGVINVVDYNASGLATIATGSITTGTKLLPLTATPDFVAGQGINLQGVFEVASLQITAPASASANCTVTLNGVAFTVALVSGDTAIQVATKIRAATYTGWTAGGTAGTDTVTFTSNTTGTKSDTVYSAGTTGATGTVTTTAQGTADQISAVSSVNGLVVTIADNSTRTITAGAIYHDDTVAIQAAFTAASSGAKIYVPPGTYRISGSTSITRSTSFSIEMAEGAIFNGDAFTGTPMFSFTGSLGTFYLLGGAITQGSVSFTAHATLAVSLSKGDLVYFSTDTAVGGSGELWTAARAYYFKGEFAVVEDVSGTTVSVTMPLFDGYTAANTMVCKVAEFNVRLDNFNITGLSSNGQIGVSIKYAKKAVVSGGRFKGFSDTCLSLSYCYGFVVRDTFMTDFYKSGLGLCYGIAVNSCQVGLIQGNDIQGGRHAVTHGGTTPVRFILVSNNPALYANKAAGTHSLDAHENCEYIVALNNNCGQITLAGRNNKANYNTIVNNYTSNAAMILFEVTKTSGFCEAIGNTFKTYGGNANDGISVRSSTIASVTIDRITIEDNKGDVDRHGIDLRGTVETAIMTNVEISRNNINCTGAGNFLVVITGSGLGTKLSTPYLKVRNNIGTTANNTMSISNTPTIGIYDICDNEFNIASGFRFGFLSTCTDAFFERNKLTGVGGNMTDFGITATGNITVRGNKFKNTGNGCPTMVATRIFVNDNIHENAGASSYTGQVIYAITNLKNYITYASVVPASGTWAVGDRWITSNPVVGQPKGGFCTVAGTPGTWVSEGNL